MEELGVCDSTFLCACPQGHTSPTFLSEETAFIRFLLLVCNQRTTSFAVVAGDKSFCFWTTFVSFSFLRFSPFLVDF